MYQKKLLKKMRGLFLYNAILISLISCTAHPSSSEIVRLSNSANDASCVFLTNDAAGNPAISWVEIDSAGTGHFYCAFWDTKAQNFGEKGNIPIPINTSVDDEMAPKIAFKNDGLIIATFETSVPIPGSKWGKGDIEYTASADSGQTWTKPVSVLGDYTYEGSIGFSSTRRLDDGEIGIAWLGTNIPPAEGRPVMFAKSDREGTFSRPIIVDSAACECCRIALSTDGRGGITVVFRDLLPGSVRDISITDSKDNGQTFIRPVSFSGDHWVIDGCPVNGPSAASTTDNTFAAWYAGSSAYESAGVYYAELDKDNKVTTKRLITPDGKFIQLCLMPDGTRIIGYNESYRQGDSTYNKIFIGKKNESGYFIKEVTHPQSNGFYPVVLPADNEHAVIAWKDRKQIFYRTVAISGITTKQEKADFKVPDTKTLTGQRTKVTNDFDPVCGMRLKGRMAGDTTISDRNVIGFCSDKCKQKFL